jgi:gliding motility-associated lipoprotein GldD
MIKWCLLIVSFVCFSCHDSYTPKPSGYSRIDFPSKQNNKSESDCPFEFLQPQYALMVKNLENKCWFDLEFNPFKGKLYMSYKSINNNLNTFTEDSRELAYKHAQQAEAISEQRFVNDSLKVYGMVYTFEGNTATPMQFYLTDSTHHFVRGALYFNTSMNDSIVPIVNFIKDDLYDIIESWQWK